MGFVELFEAAGGREGLLRLAEAWHERCLADPVVSHAFSHGFAHDHSERLAAYWLEALGGPAAYSSLAGTESEVVRMHTGNGPHDEMDRLAIACFAEALGDVGLIDPPLVATLTEWFTWATAELNHRWTTPADVPADLPIPHWTWHGPA